METKIELQVNVTKELSDELYNKLDGKEFASEIDRLTKKFEINWYLKPESKTLVVSRTFTDVGPMNASQTSKCICNLNIDAHKFVTEVEKLEHEKTENPENPEETKHNNDEYDFIKMLVDTWEATEKNAPTTGFAVLAGVDVFGLQAEVPCARIPGPLAKELCMSYLKVHSHDKD